MNLENSEHDFAVSTLKATKQQVRLLIGRQSHSAADDKQMRPTPAVQPTHSLYTDTSCVAVHCLSKPCVPHNVLAKPCAPHCVLAQLCVPHCILKALAVNLSRKHGSFARLIGLTLASSKATMSSQAVNFTIYVESSADYIELLYWGCKPC